MKMERSGRRQEHQVIYRSRREVIPGLEGEKRAGKAGHLKGETGLKHLVKKRRKGAGPEQVAGRRGGRAGLLREETGQKLEQTEGNGQTTVMENPTGEVTDRVLRQSEMP